MAEQQLQQREAEIAQWLEQEIGAAPILQALPGDAGFRRYWRLQNKLQGLPLLAVYGPPQQEKNTEFVAMANYLQIQAMPAPKVFASDLTRGFMLVEDLGKQQLFDVLSGANVEGFYKQTFNDLAQLSAAPRPDFLATYDSCAMQQEMELLRQWFIPQLLGYKLNQSESAMLDELFDGLNQTALEQPQVCVLRDFHSRNIMLRENSELAYIDFQDALWGPCTYDLVSLLRDCYVRWPRQQVEQWCEQYRCLWQQTSGIEISPQQFKTWFDHMGLQRHIKVLGIFARLYLRDGKKSYLDDLPLVIRYTLEVAEQYPQTQAFAQWFKRKLLPLAEQQPWYTNYLQAGYDGKHLQRP